jgi:hypothetical protein
MLVPILVLAGISLSIIPFVRSQLFQKEDVMLILAFFISASLLSSKGRSIGDLPQLSLILLTITALFYTFELLRMRSKDISK